MFSLLFHLLTFDLFPTQQLLLLKTKSVFETSILLLTPLDFPFYFYACLNGDVNLTDELLSAKIWLIDLFIPYELFRMTDGILFFLV